MLEDFETMGREGRKSGRKEGRHKKVKIISKFTKIFLLQIWLCILCLMDSLCKTILFREIRKHISVYVCKNINQKLI